MPVRTDDDRTGVQIGEIGSRFAFGHDQNNVILKPGAHRGGQRIHDLDLLLKRLEEHQLPREAFDWYVDLRKFGSVPHAGFGMGIERFVAWMCGLEHIRETIAFPRMLYRTRP